MNLAIITDSTCDLSQEELDSLGVSRVPLYVHFQGKIFRDWLEISPQDIIKGVAAGAELPTTSQPSPQDFELAYQRAVQGGADTILCITISAELSGTFQSASIAKEKAGVPVTVFDSRGANLGAGEMIRKAAAMRDEGAALDTIIQALEGIRDSNFVLFTVDTFEYLQKGGRIGRATALVGSLLNIKPILTLEDGLIAPVGRARGNKRALREVVSRLQAYRTSHQGELIINFLHIQDPNAAERLKAAIDAAGISYRGGKVSEIGAVVAAHVGPGTYGLYAHTVPRQPTHSASQTS